MLGKFHRIKQSVLFALLFLRLKLMVRFEVSMAKSASVREAEEQTFANELVFCHTQVGLVSFKMGRKMI